MLELLSGFPSNVVAIEGVGEVSADDYREVLIPAKLRVYPTSERAEAEAWVLSAVPVHHTGHDE